MSTMGIAVYCNSTTTTNNSNNDSTNAELILLHTLQDNEGNVINDNNNDNTNNNNQTQSAILSTKSNNVSVINATTTTTKRQTQNDNERRNNQQQQNNVPYDPSRLKKHGKNGQPPPIAVAKRNLRERNRVKQVNNGFAKLRQHIPSQIVQGYGDRGKKLSKVETLRMALEYIHGLERLLAEADGLDYDSISAQNSAHQTTMPSPAGSVYSSSTHNGSGDLLGLTGSELDEQQNSAEPVTLDVDEQQDTENYLMETEEIEDEVSDRKDVLKRFRGDEISQNRLSENQNRTVNGLVRRNRNSPATYYMPRQALGFGDEENIEPLVNQNNNNNNNNNTLLTNYSPILLQTNSSPTSLPSIKREHLQLTTTSEEDEMLRCSPENEVIAPNNIILTTTTNSPYAGEILIESPDTGRLVPVKLEDVPDNSGQFVYVAAVSPTPTSTMTTDGILPTSTYYKHPADIGVTATSTTMIDPSIATTADFMDVVSWWEQEQGRLVHQLQNHHQFHHGNGDNNNSHENNSGFLHNHHHHHHHHHMVATTQPLQNHQQTTTMHQQLTAAAGQRLAHV